MRSTLSLILPVLIPSWRFFSSVEPSPRVEWALVRHEGEAPEHWRAFRPRPAHVTPLQMLRRLFWNPEWNEDLFVVSCAERIAEAPTAHSIREITGRILTDIGALPESGGKMMRFRLVFICQSAGTASREVLFVSDPFPLTTGGMQ